MKNTNGIESDKRYYKITFSNMKTKLNLNKEYNEIGFMNLLFNIHHKIWSTKSSFLCVLPSDAQPDTMQQSPGKRLFLCLISGCGVRFNKLLSSGTNKHSVIRPHHVIRHRDSLIMNAELPPLSESESVGLRCLMLSAMVLLKWKQFKHSGFTNQVDKCRSGWSVFHYLCYQLFISLQRQQTDKGAHTAIFDSTSVYELGVLMWI